MMVMASQSAFADTRPHDGEQSHKKQAEPNPAFTKV